jgi:phosphopantetheinyl transferase
LPAAACDAGCWRTTPATAPAHLRFDLGAHGKPALSSGFGDGTIHFNLSHSHDLLLCAVSRQRRVGVDVELLRPMPAIDRMAGRVMSDAEAAAWQALPAEKKLPVFFSTWTRKEALVKGTGRAARPQHSPASTSLWRRANRRCNYPARMTSQPG